MIPKNWRYSRGDIYYANMDPNVGSEQGGERPVVVLQNDAGNKHSPTLIIATLTSRVDKKRHLPTHVLLDHNPGLKVPSIVQLEQIFTIDKRRVQRFAGQTSEEEMKQILMASFVNNTSRTASGDILATVSKRRYNQDGDYHCAP